MTPLFFGHLIGEKLSGVVIKPDVVDLVVSLSHPSLSEELELLTRRDWSITWRTARSRTTSRTRRFGSVKDVIVEILQEAGTIQSYGEIYAAVAQALEGSVARSSVKNALTRGCGGRHPAFERVGYGRYRLLQ